jgi:two-component system chemotaxis response regulator CheB
MTAGPKNIVIIGSSTGGPRVLERVFDNLPRLNASVVVVHQMVKMMNSLLRERIAATTKMDVVVAENMMSLEHGKVYVAPSEVHLCVVGNTMIQLSEGERRNRVRPSVDVAMESLKASPGTKLVGVILTGAGQDGAAGIAHMKGIGGITIAQDEKSSPVAGMPKAAIDSGKVDLVLDPEVIGVKLLEVMGLIKS